MNTLSHSLLSLFFLLTLAATCQTTALMTLNIRYDNPGDKENNWHLRKAKVIQLILQYEPAIFGIQEGLHHQVSYLDSSLTDYAYTGVGRDDGKTQGEYCAIIYDSTTFSVAQSATFWLSETPEIISVGWDAAMERICTYGLFTNRKTGETMWVLNAHFDHIGEIAREKSAGLILQKIKALNTGNLPVVLMGDFNLTPEEKPIQLFISVLTDAMEIAEKPFYGPKGTFNGFRDQIMDRRIDYIFTDNLKVISYIHVDDRRDNNLFVSDHLPVVVVVENPGLLTQKYKGIIYRNLNEIKDFQNYGDSGGVAVEDDFAIGLYTDPLTHEFAITYTDIVRDNPKVKYAILDLIQVPPLKENQHIAFGACELNEKFNDRIVAIYQHEDTEYYTHIIKAWRADKVTGRLKEIPTKNIRCVNEGYDMD